MGNFLDESFMTGAAPGGASTVPSNTLSEDFVTGMKPVVTAPRADPFAAQQAGADAGMQQVQKEGAAIWNMGVAIPGGFAGTLADLGTRLIGFNSPQSAIDARVASDKVNAAWGKLTDVLHMDSSGSKIDSLMQQGIALSDTGAARVQDATGGAIMKEDVQSIRDAILNTLGVKGAAEGLTKALAKTKVTSLESSQAGVGAQSVIDASKARIAQADTAHAQAVQDVAAGTAAPAVVDAVVAKAMEARHPLDVAWSAKARPVAAKGSSPAWDNMVRGLVEEPGAKADATLPESAMTEVSQPAPEGPGLTQKTTLAEPTIIGEAPDLVESGLDKLRQGQLISTPEATAIRALKPLPDQGVIVNAEGKPYFQRGQADPALLKTLGLMGLGAVAGTALYNWYQSSPGLSEDNARDVGMGLAGIGAVGMLHGEFEGLAEPKLIDLVKQAGADGEGAAAKLYTDTKSQLTRTVQGWDRGGKEGLPVEDIVQNTYMKAFEAIKKGQFRGESSLSTFLHKIAQNEKFNVFNSVAEKTARRSSSLEVDPETGGAIVPEKYTMEQSPEKYQSAQDQAAMNQLAQRMQTALDKLPEDQAAVFKALEMDGLSYEEAAAQLDVPIGTIRSRFSRAKENLQGSLRDYKDLQAGKADPKMLAKLALVGGGAVLGANMNPDSPKLGALAGAAGGFGLAALFHASPKEAVAKIQQAFAPDTRIRINQWQDIHDAGMVTAERYNIQQARAVVKEAPKLEDLNTITHAIQAGKINSLPPALKRGAEIAQQYFETYANAAKKAGLITDFIDDYVTNLWDLTGKNKDAWDRILNQAGGPSMSPTTRFALTRRIASLEMGKSLGLTPLTENVAAIMKIYGDSLARSIENDRMIKSLKAEVDPVSGDKLVLSGLKAPHSYVTIDSPQLTGMRVHPDIAPSIRFIFDRNNQGAILQGIQAANTAIKRSAVMASLFHAKALLDGFTAATDMNKKLVAGGAIAGALYGVTADKDPLSSALIGAGAGMMAPGMRLLGEAAAPKLFGENIYLKQLHEGSAGDLVGELLNSGLKVSMEKGKLVDEDVGGSFYAGMTALQRGMDKVLPGSGLPMKGLIELNHRVDTFMWERLHTSMKLTVAAQKFEQLIMDNGAAHAKDATVSLKPRAQLAAEASSFTNDIFGGLNWRRIAESTQSQWGRDLALQAYSPGGRRIAQLLTFAPDWTVSTTRAATQAFSPRMSDLNPVKLAESFASPQDAVGLHRQYMLRSALYYATIANGINYAMSGHYVWDNKDWTTIDLGDGRTMQWSKHMMEPVHWLQKPMQQAANKLGFMPKEVINQLTGKQYISAKGNAPPMDTSVAGRLSHIGKAMLPISAQQGLGSNASAGGTLSSTLGVPIYGRTYAERAQAKEALKQLHQTPEYKALQAERRAANLRSTQ